MFGFNDLLSDYFPGPRISFPSKYEFVTDILSHTMNSQWKIHSVLPKAIDMLASDGREKAEVIVISLLIDSSYDVQKAVLNHIREISEAAPSLGEEILKVRLHMLSQALKRVPDTYHYDILTGDDKEYNPLFCDEDASWRHQAFGAYDYRHQALSSSSSLGFFSSSVEYAFSDIRFRGKAKAIFPEIAEKIRTLSTELGACFDQLVSDRLLGEDQSSEVLTSDAADQLSEMRDRYIEENLPSPSQFLRSYLLQLIQEVDAGTLYNTDEQKKRHERYERSLFKPSPS